MKIVGRVTEDEKNEIRDLFERLNGIKELMQMYNNESFLSNEHGDSLYEKMVSDIGKTKTKYQDWWNTMSTKYDWEKSVEGSWRIDFETNDIYLV